jgi:hypothetical protein
MQAVEILVWEVGGIVAGAAVPTEPIDLEGVVCGPGADPALQWVFQTEQPQVAMTQTTATSSTAWYPHRVEVTSSTVAVCAVRARSAEEAQQLGCRRIEKACVALAMGTSYSSYAFKLRAVRMTGERVFATPFSEQASFTWHEERDLTQDEIESTRRLLQAGEADDVARKALDHLQTASSFSDMTRSDHLTKARLLSLFQVIELVSSATAREWRKANGARIRQANKESLWALKKKLAIRRLVDSVAAILAVSTGRSRTLSERNLRKEMAAVRECSLQLTRNAANFLNLQIEVAGDKLGLSPRIVDNAKLFCQIRNQELGHPGELSDDGRALLEIPAEEGGIDLAEQMARVYFTQYCSDLLGAHIPAGS